MRVDLQTASAEGPYASALMSIRRLPNRVSRAASRVTGDDLPGAYRMRRPLARGSAVTTYMAKRVGRSLVTTVVGAPEASRARAAEAKEDRMSLMMMVIERGMENGGLGRLGGVERPLYTSPSKERTRRWLGSPESSDLSS